MSTPNPNREIQIGSPSPDPTDPVMHLRHLRTALIEIIHDAHLAGWDISWNALDVFDTELIDMNRRLRNSRRSPEARSDNTEDGESSVLQSAASMEEPENGYG